MLLSDYCIGGFASVSLNTNSAYSITYDHFLKNMIDFMPLRVSLTFDTGLVLKHFLVVSFRC